MPVQLTDSPKAIEAARLAKVRRNCGEFGARVGERWAASVHLALNEREQLLQAMMLDMPRMLDLAYSAFMAMQLRDTEVVKHGDVWTVMDFANGFIQGVLINLHRAGLPADQFGLQPGQQNKLFIPLGSRELPEIAWQMDGRDVRTIQVPASSRI